MMKADKEDEEIIGSSHQKKKKAEKKISAKDFIHFEAGTGGEKEDKEEKEEEEKQIEILPYRYIYIYIKLEQVVQQKIMFTNIIRTSKFNATRKQMNLLMLYR